MSLLEQDITRKGRVNKEVRQMKFDVGDDDSEEYEPEAIRNSAVYSKESESGLLLGLYYLVSWKGYLEKENNWEPASAVEHLKKLISLFHKDYLVKPTATSPAINTTSPMARPTVKLNESLKQNRGQRANSINKQAKKNLAAFEFYRVFRQIRVISMLDILSRTAHDCIWPLANFHQNFYLLTFKCHAWLNFLGLLSLNHKASVFPLELPLGQEVFSSTTFHQYLSNHRFSSLVFRYWVGRFFSSDMIFGDLWASLRG